MATDNRRSLRDWDDREVVLEKVARRLQSQPVRPFTVMGALDQWPRADYHATPGTTRSTGRTDYFPASRPKPSRWDRIIARVTRDQPTAPEVIAADDKLTDAINQYNRVRALQGRPLVRRDDFVDVLDRPPGDDDA